MDQIGSGGIGAVSPGLLLVILVLALLLGFGLWKLVKLLLAVFR